MPCYQIVTTKLDFKCHNKSILDAAAASLGMELRDNGYIVTPSGSVLRIEGDKIVCQRGDEKLVNDLRVAYSNQVVNSIAKKLGWQKTTNKKNSYTLKKGT